MNFEHIETLPGSPEAKDIFEPHMPGVDLLSDMDGFFTKTRELLESESINEYIQNAGFHQVVHQENMDNKFIDGQRFVAIITPGRTISLAPAPLPNTKSEKELAPIKKLLPSETPLQITAISYTKLEAYMQDETKLKCIPFLGFLLAFAYLGHNVIVFEGHPSALEFGVKNSDTLFIDSGMLPFMSDNWADVVFKAMNPSPKIFIHERKNFGLTPVIKKNSHPGWRRSEPDSIPSYVNILLTTLGKANYKQKSVNIISGQPVPNPKEFTNDPDELEYISTLPFKYDQLNTDIVIKFLWDISKSSNLLDKLQSRKTFKAKLIESGGTERDITFVLKLFKNNNGKQQLDIMLI